MIRLTSIDLPFCQHISLITPWLELKIDELSFIFKFLKVSSGYVSIMQASNAVVRNSHQQLVDIADIPTTSEMQLNCLESSNELTIQLQMNRKVVIYIVFVWGKVSKSN
jgi:hypothetical protein